MRKEFTLKSYFKYVIGYWLVVAVCAVIGLACGIGLGVLTNEKQEYVYQGNICIAGISSLDSYGESAASVYANLKSDAFDTMTSETVINTVYSLIEQDWRSLPGNSKLSVSQAREMYDKQLSVSSHGPFLYVRFVITQDKHLEEYKQFAYKAVNAYLVAAKEAAEKQNSLLVQKEMLALTEAAEQIPKEVKSIGILKGGIIGVCGGVVLALVLLIIVYFADKRILSYADIAAVTGRRLLAVNKGYAANNVCPRIDAEVGGAAVVAVCGDEKSCSCLARLYGEYTACLGQKTLVLDFCRGADDGFAKFIGGEPIENCVTQENGAFILHGENSWAQLLSANKKTDELKKIYTKIIICAPYSGDGSTSVLNKAADKTVFAVNQKNATVKCVLGMAAEANAGEKAIGAVIDCAGRSFVGADTYTASSDDED